MNRALKFVCLVLVLIGTVLACFTDVPLLEFSALAVAFIGAAITAVETYRKSEKKDWKVIVSIVLIAVGALGLGFAGVAADAISKIIAAVGGVVLLIFGLFVSGRK